MEHTWSDLVERARSNNDQDAYYELYQSSYDAVYRTVKSMVKDEDDTMDIVQDAFVKGFDSLSSLDNPENFVPWMKRIATNKAKDWFKKKHDIAFSQMADEEGNEPDFEDESLDQSPEAALDQKETARLIDEILRSLSDEQRIAIGMFYYQNMTVAEIAEELGVSENTVKSRLNYGRQKIKMGVLELEKKGTKLYSLSPIAFLLWLFRSQSASPSVGGAPAAMFGNIMASTAAQSTAAAVSGTAAASTAASAATGTATVSSTGGGLFATVGAKVTAVVLAAAVTVGGVGTAIYFANREDGEVPTAPETTTSATARTTPAGSKDTKPMTEPITEPVTEPDAKLVVLPEAYEELNSDAVAEIADHRVVLAKKDGKWGVINEKGEIVIPFEYDSIDSPTASGHMRAKKSDPDTNQTMTSIFDSNGNELLSSDKSVYCGNGIAMIGELSYKDEEDPWLSYDKLEVIRLSTGKTLMEFDYAAAYLCSSLDDCFMVASVPDVESYNWAVFNIYNQKGETLLHRGTVVDYFVGYGSVRNGYYYYKDAPTISTPLWSLDGSRHYEVEEWEGDFSVSSYLGLLLLLRSHNEPESEEIEGGKYYLLDLNDISDREYVLPKTEDLLSRKGYDSISTNVLEKYFLVYDGDRQGFLSRDGKTERLFDGAGDFVRDRAIVLENGVIYVIDENFTCLSEQLEGYTSVKTVGERLYGVEKDGEWYLAVFNEDEAASVEPEPTMPEPTYSEGLEFELADDGESYIVAGIGECTDTDIVIPAIYNGLPVTGIGEGAFDSCHELTSITIPEGVTGLGMCALSGIKNITLPKSLEIIDIYAFSTNENININYNGTIAEWNAIRKFEGSVPIYLTVHCTDGDMTDEI